MKTRHWAALSFVVGFAAVIAAMFIYYKGRESAYEEITATCVRVGVFEFRTYSYMCDLTPESHVRVFSQDVDT